jgi:hypothetical protein
MIVSVARVATKANHKIIIVGALASAKRICREQLLQRHWDSERLPAQFGNSVASGTMISRSAFYPTVPDHVTEYSFACRRQSLMGRPLRLHELLQNFPLPHVGVIPGHSRLQYDLYKAVASVIALLLRLRLGVGLLGLLCDPYSG